MANNNQPTSFIQQMINQRGQDWIVTMTPENIQKNAKRIVRDIARGFIDYDKCGYIFLDPKFTENLIIAIRNELEIVAKERWAFLSLIKIYHFSKELYLDGVSQYLD